MSTNTLRPTPETDAAIIAANGTWTFELKEAMQKLERERDEMREELQQWKMLCAWGGTPEHIEQFIKGQQSRIHQAQDIEETCEQLERELGKTREQLKAMREAIREVSLQLTFAEKVSGASVLHIYVYDALAKLKPFIAHE